MSTSQPAAARHFASSPTYTFCPPASTPPGSARGEACSLMKAMRFFMDPSQGNSVRGMQGLGKSRCARGGAAENRFPLIREPRQPELPEGGRARLAPHALGQVAILDKTAHLFDESR